MQEELIQVVQIFKNSREAACQGGFLRNLYRTALRIAEDFLEDRTYTRENDGPDARRD